MISIKFTPFKTLPNTNAKGAYAVLEIRVPLLIRHDEDHLMPQVKKLGKRAVLDILALSLSKENRRYLYSTLKYARDRKFF